MEALRIHNNQEAKLFKRMDLESVNHTMLGTENCKSKTSAYI
jgi:hypothetical protein